MEHDGTSDHLLSPFHLGKQKLSPQNTQIIGKLYVKLNLSQVQQKQLQPKFPELQELIPRL